MDALLRRRQMMLAGGSPTPPDPPTPPGPPTPEGVVFYDYLYFDGVAKIETDIILPPLASFAVPLGKETNKAAQRVFISSSGSGNLIQCIYGSSTTSTKRYLGTYYGSSSNLTTNNTINFSTETFNYFLTPKRVGYDSTGWSITKGSGYPTEGTLKIGGWSTGNPYSGRMGTFLIFGSDAQNATTYNGLLAFTPVYTLRPCTYNGEAGFWCVETDSFYGNTAESGALIASNS